jgi:hypothetical protein
MTSKPEVQARSKSGDVLRVMYSERVMHEAATPLPKVSRLEEEGRCIATEVSPLCHTLYTFSPLIKDQHQNTAKDQDISVETQSHSPSSE